MSLVKRIENGTTTYRDSKLVRTYIWVGITGGFILGVLLAVSLK